MDVHVSMWGSTEAGRIGQMFCCVFSTLGSALSPVWRLSLKVWQFTTWRKKGRMIFTTKLREERNQDFLQIYSWVKCTQTAGSWNVIKTLFKVSAFDQPSQATFTSIPRQGKNYVWCPTNQLWNVTTGQTVILRIKLKSDDINSIFCFHLVRAKVLKKEI